MTDKAIKWAKGVVQDAAGEALPWMQDGPIWKERADAAESELSTLRKMREALKDGVEAVKKSHRRQDCYCDICVWSSRAEEVAEAK